MLRRKRNRPAAVQFPQSGVYVAESRHADDFRMEPTIHAFGKLLYIWGGAGSLVVKGRRWPLRPGRIAVIPPGISHYLCDDPRRPLSLYFLCVRNPVLAMPGTAIALGECRVIGHAPLSETVRRLFQDLLYEQTAGDAGADLMVTGRVLELCGLLLRWRIRKDTTPGLPPKEKSLSRARVGAVIAEMRRRFYRPQSLERAAARAGLKSRRFSQIFREIAGTSWPAFLRERRIDHAKCLLAETNRSIVAVCFECGFEDLSSFYRAFRRIEGVSPLAWRKAN